MTRSFKDALEFALKKTGRSLREVTRAAGVSYEQYKGFMQGKSRSTNVDDAFKVAQAFGVSVEDFFAGDLDTATTITIAGTVGAGARVPVFDAYEKGDGPQVECPPGLSPHGIVAVEIEGDSMEPTFSAGDLLFYTRHTHEGVPVDVIGHRCVVEDETGMGWVKQVKLGSGPGLFNLISLNPTADNMHDIKLKWAARVRLHWPAELARKV
ncbi:MAG: S24 family peptidase [Salipiger thiooxidans]|uniref:XRE family transcriptional regulator n=1 Tax=Salipiger thiooxidans TaxID=282683 RepID=UPI001CF9745F|nr:XRE family transcriptional regulator [Salipiger thiooxidans]